jgi:hypothetical protein
LQQALSKQYRITKRKSPFTGRKRKMKNLLGMFMIMATAFVVSSAEAQTNAPAATPEVVKEETPFPLTFAATLDIYSAYIWHGMIVNDEPVWQPYFGLTYSFGDYGSVTADTWMNFDTTGNNSQRHVGGINEIDYTLTYAVNLGDLSLGISHIWYTFPSVSDTDYYNSTREILVSAAYNNDIVVPFVKAYYDYAEAKGVYVTVGLRKEMTFDKLTAGAEVFLSGASHSYTEFWYSGAESQYWFTDAQALVYAKYSITDNIFVGARIGWVSTMDNELKDVYSENNLLWGGINLGISL